MKKMAKVTTTTTSTSLRALLDTASVDTDRFKAYWIGNEHHYEVTFQNNSGADIYIERGGTATSSASFQLSTAEEITLKTKSLADIELLASATTKDLIVI